MIELLVELVSKIQKKEKFLIMSGFFENVGKSSFDIEGSTCLIFFLEARVREGQSNGLDKIKQISDISRAKYYRIK